MAVPGSPLAPDENGPRPGRRWARDHRVLVAATAAAVLAVVLVTVVIVRAGGSGDDVTTANGRDVGAAMGDAIEHATTTAPSNQSPPISTTTTRPVKRVQPPPLTIPARSSPPTTLPGAKPSSVPGAHGNLPLWGHLLVDLTPGGYKDFAVHLRKDQNIQVLSLADDGIFTQIDMFAPDRTNVGSWKGGQPGVVNGLEFSADSPLPATGTYVIRVQHTGGSDRPFLIGFFGQQ
jgi:hypothetical protein